MIYFLIKPTDYDTNLAIRPRATVNRWLVRTRTSSRSRQQGENVWKTQDKTTKTIHEQPTLGKEPLYSPQDHQWKSRRCNLLALTSVLHGI
jgi:hypothetical protein